MVTRYVIVSTDPADKIIKDGPILWDGVTVLNLPSGQQSMLESNAIAAGYTYPPDDPSVVNVVTLRQRAGAAIAANITYLAIASPTNAQVAAQVRLLTRECTALIRLALSLTDSTDGS